MDSDDQVSRPQPMELVVGAPTTAPESSRPAEPLHRALGLTDGERDEVEAILGRPPNHLELALFAVMWSEHCSYKSSRVHLKRLPTEAPHVLVGPGENAGVIDAGDGIAVAIRIESHNHPSAIEPYQGAATGVGGILRDIFTMGARPIAVMDPLFFGDPTEARQQWLIEGVVAGISGYGNSVGRAHGRRRAHLRPLLRPEPTGQRAVHGGAAHRAAGAGPGLRARATWRCCSARPPVGTGSAGSACWPRPASAVRTTSARGGGQAARASRWATPTRRSASSRRAWSCSTPSWWWASRTWAGPGLVCATSETAARGGVGMDVDVSAVPRREPGMAAYEVMTSESQERMLAIVTPEDLARVEEVCRRWEVRAAVVGRVTEAPDGAPGRLRILDGFDGEVLGDVPAVALSEDAPLYHRPAGPPRRSRRPGRPTIPASLPPPADCGADVLALLADPSWVYRQYDHQLFLNTVDGPGGDAAVLRLAAPGLPPSEQGLALTTDSNPDLVLASTPGPAPRPPWPRAPSTWPAPGPGPWPWSTASTSAIPSTPRSCGSCPRPSTGWPRPAWPSGLPVIGGNVSLYNESYGADIDPTPVIGVLGLIDRLAARPPG